VKFITDPKVHATELRCYMRDPDEYLTEGGQTIMTVGPLDLCAIEGLSLDQSDGE
jgi:hypothetical protein